MTYETTLALVTCIVGNIVVVNLDRNPLSLKKCPTVRHICLRIVLTITVMEQKQMNWMNGWKKVFSPVEPYGLLCVLCFGYYFTAGSAIGGGES